MSVAPGPATLSIANRTQWALYVLQHGEDSEEVVANSFPLLLSGPLWSAISLCNLACGKRELSLFEIRNNCKCSLVQETQMSYPRKCQSSMAVEVQENDQEYWKIKFFSNGQETKRTMKWIKHAENWKELAYL